MKGGTIGFSSVLDQAKMRDKGKKSHTKMKNKGR